MEQVYKFDWLIQISNIHSQQYECKNKQKILYRIPLVGHLIDDHTCQACTMFEVSLLYRHNYQWGDMDNFISHNANQILKC